MANYSRYRSRYLGERITPQAYYYIDGTPPPATVIGDYETMTRAIEIDIETSVQNELLKIRDKLLPYVSDDPMQHGNAPPSNRPIAMRLIVRRIGNYFAELQSIVSRAGGHWTTQNSNIPLEVTILKRLIRVLSQFVVEIQKPGPFDLETFFYSYN